MTSCFCVYHVMLTLQEKTELPSEICQIKNATGLVSVSKVYEFCIIVFVYVLQQETIYPSSQVSNYQVVGLLISYFFC